MIVLAALAAGIGIGGHAWGRYRAAPRIVATMVLPARAPYSVRDGAVLIEAGLGSGPAIRAVMDVGLAECIVAPDLAASSGVSGTGEVMIAGPIGHLKAAPTAPQSVRVGRVKVDGLALCVSDPYKQWTDNPPAGGNVAWLGNSVLSLFTLELDPQASEVTLEAPDPSTDAPGPWSVPITENSGRLEVRAKADSGAEFRAILTTGMRGVLIPASALSKLQPIPGTERTVKTIGGGSIRVGAVRLKELRIGTAKTSNVSALAVLERSADQVDDVGVIGTDVLLRFRIRINYLRRVATFAPARTARRERPVPRERPTLQRQPGLGIPRRNRLP